MVWVKGVLTGVVVIAFLAVIAAAMGAAVIGVAFLGGFVHAMSSV